MVELKTPIEDANDNHIHSQNESTNNNYDCVNGTIINNRNMISLNVKVIFNSKCINFIAEIPLTSTVHHLKHNIYQQLKQRYNKSSTIPDIFYFDMITIKHPNILEIFELYEEDEIIDIMTNSINEWIYIFNKNDTNPLQILNNTNDKDEDDDIHQNEIFVYSEMDAFFEKHNTEYSSLHFENKDIEDIEDIEDSIEKYKSVAPMLWHAYQAAKYTSEQNSMLARVNKIHYKFFGGICWALKYMQIWNDDILQKNMQNEMKMHGLLGDDLSNTINFGLKLTQNQVLDIVATTPWLPSELCPLIKTECHYNGNNKEKTIKRYNVKLSMFMHVRKVFDGEVQKTKFTADEIKNYLKIFGEIVGLHPNEIKYVANLYETEIIISKLHQELI